MARTLAAWVHLPGPDGATVSLGPGTAPPKWAAEQITNPKAWAAHDPDTAEGDEPGGAREDGVGDGPQAPKGNASKAEWVEHAINLGIEVEDDWKVADIKAAVAAHAPDTGEDGTADDTPAGQD